MRAHPFLYEINATSFLERLSRKYQKKLTLGAVPESEWKRLASLGFEWLWIMGLWQRSPAAREKDLGEPKLRQSYSEALPGWREEDVWASPYAVHAYRIDPRLGSEQELLDLKLRLRGFGLRLMVDFVGNHFALDHPWTLAHPEWFIRASEAEAGREPGFFFKTSTGDFLAHGRDPYFPPWTDTVQVNYFSLPMREAMASELERLTQMADGVRCDMAMLSINSVFRRTWGAWIDFRQELADEFWPTAIRRARARKPGFLFLAESYWNMEWQLQEMGFDYTYDKTFYERLLAGGTAEIRDHLKADLEYQVRSARFIENHDEARALTAFGRKKSMAAAVAVMSVPGLALVHDGQCEGRRVRLPVQLARGPEETSEPELESFYTGLFEILRDPVFHEGEWKGIDPAPAWEGAHGHDHLLAWCWTKGRHRRIVVINYSEIPCEGRVPIEWDLKEGRQVSLRDLLSGEVHLCEGSEVQAPGLLLQLKPWQSRILACGGTDARL